MNAWTGFWIYVAFVAAVGGLAAYAWIPFYRALNPRPDRTNRKD